MQTQNLTLRYKDGKRDIYAVNSVNINLPERGFFGILGPSGSGKTSLLYLLSGIKKPSGGEIVYRGENFSKINGRLKELRKKEMGFVFQFHFLINYLNVEQNIMVGAKQFNKKNKKKAQKLMDGLGLKGLERRSPHELSGGQRQRVAIARSLINDPKIIFVDEPTASLDHETGENVVDLLEQSSKRSCVIAVTHDETILKGANGIFKMWDGHISQLN